MIYISLVTRFKDPRKDQETQKRPDYSEEAKIKEKSHFASPTILTWLWVNPLSGTFCGMVTLPRWSLLKGFWVFARGTWPSGLPTGGYYGHGAQKSLAKRGFPRQSPDAEPSEDRWAERFGVRINDHVPRM